MTVSVPNVASKKTFESIADLDNYTPTLPRIAEVLTRIVAKGDKDLKGVRPQDELSLWYNGVEPAAISVQDYLIRLCKYGLGSPEVYVHMVIYLGRLRAKVGVAFQSYNIHRVMLTAFTVAAKLRDDRYYSNAYYARIGGVGLDDLNRMEQVFLTDCNWDLWISEAEYAATEQRLGGSCSRPLSPALPPAGEEEPAGVEKRRRRKSTLGLSNPVKMLHNSFGTVLNRFRKNSTASTGEEAGAQDPAGR